VPPPPPPPPPPLLQTLLPLQIYDAAQRRGVARFPEAFGDKTSPLYFSRNDDKSGVNRHDVRVFLVFTVLISTYLKHKLI
jgi:hypothetical protein